MLRKYVSRTFAREQVAQHALQCWELLVGRIGLVPSQPLMAHEDHTPRVLRAPHGQYAAFQELLVVDEPLEAEQCFHRDNVHRIEQRRCERIRWHSRQRWLARGAKHPLSLRRRWRHVACCGV